MEGDTVRNLAGPSFRARERFRDNVWRECELLNGGSRLSHEQMTRTASALIALERAVSGDWNMRAPDRARRDTAELPVAAVWLAIAAIAAIATWVLWGVAHG